MQTSALAQLELQRPIQVPTAHRRFTKAPGTLQHPQQHVRYRRGVAVQYALLEDVDWPQLSRMLLPPMLSAAAFRKMSESLAKRAAIDEVCRAFQVQDKEELQVGSIRQGVVWGCLCAGGFMGSGLFCLQLNVAYVYIRPKAGGAGLFAGRDERWTCVQYQPPPMNQSAS